MGSLGGVGGCVRGDVLIFSLTGKSGQNSLT